MKARFTESDLKAIGGLSKYDRIIPGLDELVPLAAQTSSALREALGGSRKVSRWLEDVMTICSSQLREANSETALGFLLRKGVQVIANDWYNLAQPTWRDYCRVTGSTTLAEWYAPLYGSVIPGRVQRGQQFPEGRIQGEDNNLVNQKFGAIEAFERELFDDDQTGQIQQRAQNLGAGMAVAESIWAGFRYLGTQRTYANLTVTASAYSTTDPSGNTISSPFSTTLYSSTTGNRPTNFAPLSANTLKNAIVSLMNATDPLNNKLVVNPNILLISTMDRINADLLMAPGMYPAVVGQGGTSLGANPVLGGTVSAAGANQGALTGFPGGWGSPNLFARMGLKVVIERYWPAWACAVGEQGKGFIFQERDPLEIQQESPATGAAFTFDVIKYRSRRRFEADWVGGGSRFHYLLNDSTSTGNQ